MRGFHNLVMCYRCSNHWTVPGSNTNNFNILNDFIHTIKRRSFRTSSRHFRLPRRSIRSEADRPYSLENLPQSGPGSINGGRLWKPVLFTAAFGSGTVAAAAIWQYENHRSSRLSFSSGNFFRNWNNISPSVEKQFPIRQQLNRWWKSLTEAEKIFAPICFANALVYLAWKNPRWESTMVKYFCTNAAAKALCWPMLLSTYSHYMFLHLAANMFVLHSFSQGVVPHMGKEQFLAMYTIGGLVASLASLISSVALRRNGISLGASGAVMAVIGYSCSAFPNSQVSLIFLPTVSINADTALKSLMAVDMLGLILRWRFFDHAAHLGGALLGLMWFHFGRHYIWGNRELVVKPWHQWRESTKDK